MTTHPDDDELTADAFGQMMDVDHSECRRIEGERIEKIKAVLEGDQEPCSIDLFGHRKVNRVLVVVEYQNGPDGDKDFADKRDLAVHYDFEQDLQHDLLGMLAIAEGWVKSGRA